MPTIPTMTNGSTSRVSHRKFADLAIAGIFICLMAVQIARHQMWRDELNAWGLVLASPTLPELFHNLHYEGHPGLWHFLLWCASWFTRSPGAMKAVHACIAVGFILLIAFRSPFTRLEKILILLNFYVVFEYAVVSRNYGVGLLLALIYVQLRVTRPDRLVLNATVLGLLANTNVYAAIMSGALACEVVVDRFATSRWLILRTVRQLAPAAIVYLGFLLFCAVTINPATDISWRTTDYPFQHSLAPLRLLWVMIHYLDVGLVPAARWLEELPRPRDMLLGLALLPIFSSIVIWQFRRDWRPLLTLGLTALGVVAFGQLVYPGSIRHWGIIFVAFVVALWMQRWTHREPKRHLGVLVILAFGALAGIREIERDAVQPHSLAGAAAQWLLRNEPSVATLIGTPDTVAAAVAELLDRPMYFLDCNCVDTFLRYTKRRDDYKEEQLVDRLDLAMKSVSARPMVLVTNSALSQNELSAIDARRMTARSVASFTGAFEPDENFYLYEVTDGIRQ